MIRPINGHVLIDPIKRDDFIPSSREVFEEIGIVVEYDKSITGEFDGDSSMTVTTTTAKIARPKLQVGDKVYFDAWLAAKFPKNKEEFYWLVKWEDVRAIEYGEKE